MNTADTPILRVLYDEPDKNTKRIIKIAAVVSSVALIALLALVVHRFYKTGQLSARYWFFFTRRTTWVFLLEGLAGTLEAAVLSGAIAFLLGFLFMTARISSVRPLRVIATLLIEFTRGVPTLLFIYFFFLALPRFGIQLKSLFTISFPVAISASGIVAEMLRSGVQAVPKGQREASLALGMGEAKTFLLILFPQGFRYVLPALISELVIVLKDTTFAYIVSFPDLMQNAKVLISNYDAMLSVYLFVALVYIMINYLLNKLSVFAASKSYRRGL